MSDKFVPVCANCKHCYWPGIATGSEHLMEQVATCRHPEAGDKFSVVVGLTGRRAMSMRAGACGADAKYFEAAKTPYWVE